LSNTRKEWKFFLQYYARRTQHTKDVYKSKHLLLGAFCSSISTWTFYPEYQESRGPVLKMRYSTTLSLLKSQRFGTLNTAHLLRE